MDQGRPAQVGLPCFDGRGDDGGWYWKIFVLEGGLVEIALHEISKTYDPGLFKKKVVALTALSLEIAQGEVFGLVGPNGAGKSTAIRLLLGLSRPDRGDILFRGEPLEHSDFKKEIGYLPENPYLYDNLTLSELLDFGGRVSGLKKGGWKRRSQELVERLQMTGSMNRSMRTFSKGMRQRAGICYALLHDPSVLILDEPMSGLDPLGRRLLFDLVMDLKSQGKTIFFCSHILSDVERLCDRIGLLVKGRLIKEFDKSLFVENPALPIHLVVGPLRKEQQQVLEVGGVEVELQSDFSLVSLAPERLVETVELLDRLGIKVLGTRSGKVSLEQLFLESINSTGGGE